MFQITAQAAVVAVGAGGAVAVNAAEAGAFIPIHANEANQQAYQTTDSANVTFN